MLGSPCLPQKPGIVFLPAFRLVSGDLLQVVPAVLPALWDAGRAQDHCSRQLEQGRICCVTLWQLWLGISWDATPLQLMLAFSSLFLSLFPTFHILTGACTPPKDARVYLPYHKLEEHPVLIGQKFLIEVTEHLKRSKGGLSSGRVTVLVPWVAHSLLACPGHTCTSTGLPTRAGVLQGFCWSQ